MIFLNQFPGEFFQNVHILNLINFNMKLNNAIFSLGRIIEFLTARSGMIRRNEIAISFNLAINLYL